MKFRRVPLPERKVRIAVMTRFFLTVVITASVLLAHFGGSVLWVFSTVLLQMEVPDQFRGRVFAAELALVTLVTSLSSYFTAYALDHAGWSPRGLSFTLGALFCVPGFVWLLILSRWTERSGEPAEAALEPVSEAQI